MAVLRNHLAVRWDLDLAFRAAGLDTPFPRGITFADVDGETEINGQYLVMEGKRADEELSLGQAYTMDARVRDGRTCVVVYGEPPTGIVAMRVWGAKRHPVVLDAFWSFVREWVQWAETNRRPNQSVNAFMQRWRAAIAQTVDGCGQGSPDKTEACAESPGHSGPHKAATWVWPQGGAAS